MSSKLPKVGKNEITENIFQEFLLSTEMINEFLPPALPTTHFQVGPKTNISWRKISIPLVVRQAFRINLIYNLDSFKT